MPGDPLPRFGAGIALRRLRVSDLAAFQAYRSDPELGRYQGWSPMSEPEAHAFLEEMNGVPLFRPGEWAQIGIAAPETMTLLGDIGFHLSEDSCHAEIGFTLVRWAQGRGLATAAVREALQLVFQLTTAERVLGTTDARNQASIAVLKRVGMHKQGERNVDFHGEPCLEHVYVVPRPAS